MAKPSRHTETGQILSSSRTFFVTTKTSMGGALLQSERNATLFVDVLRSYAREGKFQVHDFVVMPDHAHPLITLSGQLTIKQAMQLIKGGFSYCIKKEHRYSGESLAAWILGVAGRRSRQLCAPSRIHRPESGSKRFGGYTRRVPVLLQLFGTAEGPGG